MSTYVDWALRTSQSSGMKRCLLRMGTEMRSVCLIPLWLMLALHNAYGQALYESELILDPSTESRGHVHASCIVECPNGDLLAVWYENGTRLPSFEYE
jgi:hypothetical protein